LNAQLRATHGNRAKAKLVIKILAVEAAIEQLQKNAIIAFKKLPKTFSRGKKIMTTISQKIKECELLLKEIEENWNEDNKMGYLHDSYEAARYCKILEKIARLKWIDAGQTDTMPTNNDLINWAQEKRGKYTIPQQFNPNQSYLKIGLIDFQQLREDYWKYYSFDHA
jgi:hypothetical protein